MACSQRLMHDPGKDKAIDTANALPEENMEDGIAISTAIGRAKDWAVNHEKEVMKSDTCAKNMVRINT